MKKENLFLNTWFTLITIWFWAPAVTFQDWSSYNLTFGEICSFLRVRDRCHAPLLLEHSVERPLGHRWLIRHFGDIHSRQVPLHLYLHHRSIGFEGCRSWQRRRSALFTEQDQPRRPPCPGVDSLSQTSRIEASKFGGHDPHHFPPDPACDSIRPRKYVNLLNAFVENCKFYPLSDFTISLLLCIMY